MKKSSTNFAIQLPDCLIESKYDYVDHEYLKEFKTVGDIRKHLRYELSFYQDNAKFKYEKKIENDLRQIIWCLDQYKSNTKITVSC